MLYYIILRGPLGVGKSTIAKKLVKILNAKVIHFDLVLKKYGLDKVDPLQGCISEKNFISANKKVIPKAKNILKKENVLIFDGCFYHKKQITNLIKLMKFLKADYRIFTLKAPVIECIKRDRLRNKTYGEDAARCVHKLVSRFDYGITINTKGKTANQIIKKIISYLPKD